MAAGDKYLAAKHAFYGTPYEVRDMLARLISGENPDGTPYHPPLLDSVVATTDGVKSINGEIPFPDTGDVVITPSDIGAVDSSTIGKAMGMCIYTGSAYPARPAGFAVVMWIGPVDPGVSAATNDLWVDNS